jgi:hypothetical protein
MKKCEDFAPNYVSNPNTMKCEYCGKHCSRCTLQDGCVECAYGFDTGKGLPNVTNYKNLITENITFGGDTFLNFPYSLNENTANNAPSSKF